MPFLSEIANIQAGLNVRSAEDGVGVPVLTMASLSGVHASGCEPSSLFQAEHDDGMDEKKYRVQPHDILLAARTTPDYLRPIILESGFQEAHLFSASLLRIRLKEPETNPWWLLGYLQSEYGLKQIIQGSQSTTGQLNLNSKALSSIDIPLPSIQEQFRIGELIRLSHTAHRTATAAADLRLKLAQAIAFQPTDH